MQKRSPFLFIGSNTVRMFQISTTVCEKKTGYSASSICAPTLVWTDGERIVAIDFRIYSPEGDGKTKNDHVRELLDTAESRGFKPRFVLFDSWYSSPLRI